jgi:hypothetical protein
MVGSSLPEWPTMSALAKFTTIRSNAVSLTALTMVSPMASAFISGARSYVATFSDGISMRSSPGKGVSTPPLKKYVTCANFSVSATRRLRRWCCGQHVGQECYPATPAE